jgi:hypothetical protein
MDNEPIIESFGNVFIDLGFSLEEATLLAMRAEFMNNTLNNLININTKLINSR